MVLIEKDFDWRLRVFDSMSFPTLILKPDRTIISANEIFLQQINESLARIVGKTCKEIFRRHFPHQYFPCSGQDCPLADGDQKPRRLGSPDRPAHEHGGQNRETAAEQRRPHRQGLHRTGF